MKLIESGEYKTVSNAWGRDIQSKTDIFEIEASDIGQTRPYYSRYDPRGPQYSPKHTFTRADVGRQIAVYYYEGWTSWTFHTMPVSHG